MSDKDSKGELKPCPCCESVETNVQESATKFSVVCLDCGLSSQGGDRDTAIKRWNTRPITPKEESKFCECVNPPLISDGRFTNICATCNKPRKPKPLDLGMFAVKIASGKYGKIKILEILERIVERAREDVDFPPTKDQTEKEA